ncbi:MAG: hypothetical protein C5B49_07215 [Bdellovibrio sp.]|nr:MAG: hypothetical protein C5B49_07215 [Bdellovibrio sp.]
MPTAHQHGPQCGHKKIPHGNHTDYLNDEGLLDCANGQHPVAISENNPDKCKPLASSKHVHDDGCGHAKVMHGNHLDYLVDGRLEHPHGDHIDDHGQLEVEKDSQEQTGGDPRKGPQPLSI